MNETINSKSTARTIMNGYSARKQAILDRYLK